MSLNRIVADKSHRVILALHDAIHRLRFYSNSLIHILSLSNSHNNVAPVLKNRGDKSDCVIVALRRISCHGRNYSQPYFFKRNQSSDNRSHGFGAKFLLKKLSASDFSYERKSAFKLQLHDAIYRLRFYSNSLIHILSLSNLHNNVASLQKNQGDKSHCVIVALQR